MQAWGYMVADRFSFNDMLRNMTYDGHLTVTNPNTVKQDISADMLFSRFSRLTSDPRK